MRKFIKVNRDLTNQKNNLLTAISKLEKNNRWYWECLCDCGNTTTIREDFFISGKTKSCGCIGSRNSIYKLNQKSPGESAHNSHYRSYKNTAKRRNIEFLLNNNEFLTLTSNNCFYCDSNPTELCYNKHSHGIALANGIDRIDSAKSYSIDNCVTCCKNCNFAKASLSQENFFNLIKTIYTYHNLGDTNEFRGT